MSSLLGLLKPLVRPFASRKVRVALATVIVVYAGQAGLELDPVMVATILAMGAAVILGIAHEDAGAKSAGKHPSQQ